MADAAWARLARPFPPDALRWRVVELAADGRSARVVPELAAAAIRERLDRTFGVPGWSFRVRPFGDRAVGCDLTAGGTTKSAVVDAPGAPRPGEVDAPPLRAAALADSALAGAARAFGLTPPADAEVEYWVDYDPEAHRPLHEPEWSPASSSNAPSGGPASFEDDGALPGPAADSAEDRGAAPVGAAADDAAETPAAAPLGSDADPDAGKSAGQVAIDRLVDRLRAEGRGLEAAKLLNEFGGYGRDPDQARALYGRLRALLLEREPS